MTQEAYSHEVISAGFWAGSGAVQEAAFYAYAAPEPAGLRDLAMQPSAAYYTRRWGSSSCRMTRSERRRRPPTRSWPS